MVKLLINDTYFDFVGTHNPVNFYYNLTQNRYSQYEGELILKEIEGKINTTDIKNISLMCNSFILNLSEFEKVNIKQQNNFFTLNIKFKDIFKIFEQAAIFFNNVFKRANSTYHCFATSMNCNLDCPYCIYGCSNDIKHQEPKYYLADFYIKKVIGIIDNVCNPEYDAIRIMGGETLIDMNSFKYTVEYGKSLMLKKLKDIWIYTNLTINVDEFIKFIDECLEKNISEKITIAFTSDSFDYKISKRINNELLMKQYKENCIKVINHYKNNDRVLIASNLMYISNDECYKTAKILYDLGLEFLQISYDEFTSRNKIDNIINNISNIYKKLEKEGFKRLKNNLGKTMWFHFFINNGEENVFQCKYSFKSDYVISKFNNY